MNYVQQDQYILVAYAVSRKAGPLTCTALFFGSLKDAFVSFIIDEYLGEPVLENEILTIVPILVNPSCLGPGWGCGSHGGYCQYAHPVGHLSIHSSIRPRVVSPQLESF